MWLVILEGFYDSGLRGFIVHCYLRWCLECNLVKNRAKSSLRIYCTCSNRMTQMCSNAAIGWQKLLKPVTIFISMCLHTINNPMNRNKLLQAGHDLHYILKGSSNFTRFRVFQVINIVSHNCCTCVHTFDYDTRKFLRAIEIGVDGHGHWHN